MKTILAFLAFGFDRSSHMSIFAYPNILGDLYGQDLSTRVAYMFSENEKFGFIIPSQDLEDGERPLKRLTCKIYRKRSP